MSDQEPENGKIHIKVDDSPKVIRLQDRVNELEAQVRERQELLESLANAEFIEQKEELAKQYPEKADVILAIENPSEMETIKSLLSDNPPKRKPTGVVTLESSSKPDIMTRPFNTRQEMMTALLEEEKHNPDVAEKVDLLWRKTVGKTSPKWSLQQPSPKIKSPSERYCEYVNSKGYTVLVPIEHAQRLSSEELAKRLTDGYYG